MGLGSGCRIYVGSRVHCSEFSVETHLRSPAIIEAPKRLVDSSMHRASMRACQRALPSQVPPKPA